MARFLCRLLLGMTALGAAWSLQVGPFEHGHWASIPYDEVSDEHARTEKSSTQCADIVRTPRLWSTGTRL
jgi:hypothetical protein